MEILESSPSSRVTIKLDSLKPFEAHNTAEFTLEPSGGSTNVMWAMHGPNRYLGKVRGSPRSGHNEVIEVRQVQEFSDFPPTRRRSPPRL